MGRPPSKPKRFKDGFYIEVRNKGADSGMKIWSESREEMLRMADSYRQNKDVVIMGEHKKDRWVDIEPAPRPRGRQKAVPKVVVEEADPLDELLGDIDIDAIEEVGDDKGPGKKGKSKADSGPKEKKPAKETSKATKVAAPKPKVEVKAKAKPAPKAKAKPAAKPKAVAKPKAQKVKPKAKPAAKVKSGKKKH